MIWVLTAIAALVITIPMEISFNNYKKRYRKAHPRCWIIPPTSTSWLSSTLQVYALVAVVFGVLHA